MPSSNGESQLPQGPLELAERLVIETNEGDSLAFEVVGILEDPEEGASYAVLMYEASEGDQQFIVTDISGNLLEDDAVAQQILDEFLAHAREEDAEEERD